MSKTQQTGILYVDDENLALKYFSEIFGDRMLVFTAQSPEMGLELFKEHQNQIGVVLSDKNMPGMSGFDLLSQVREINDTPLRILLTAYKDLGEAVEQLNSGLLDSYLTKPWEPEEMLAKIRKKLDLFWIKQQKAQLLKDRSTKFQEMLMAEKVSSIGTLSFGFSQQISNSLGAIRSYFDSIPTQLSQEFDEPPKDDFFWSEYYSSISRKIDHIESIFVGLSNCSIPNRLEFQESLNLESGINLAQLIGEVGSAETAKQPEISYAIRGETEQHIEADPEKLLRLFSNLFRESFLNIGDKTDGKVDVIIEEDIHTDGSPGLSIYFNDNGNLLTTKQKQHLFDPFYLRTDSVSPPGSRMLACYIITYQHGGFLATNKEKDIDYNSIHLWLPLVNRQPTDSEASKNFLDSLS